MPDEAPSTVRAVRSRVASPTVALAALAAGLVLAVSVVVFPYHSTNHDEAVYLQQAAMLLEGQLFLRPPVPDAVHPWFFVRDGDALYSKYTPVTAGVFAAGKALAGSYRVALAAVAAGNVALAVALGREAFDRRTGLLAGALLLGAPMFLVTSATFLSYAPATLFNLTFAYAYVRGERARAAGRSGTARRYATAAGFAAGLAFFARPYTAVLFAAPFVAHAVGKLALSRDREVVVGNALTAAVGLAWVGVALAYNAVVTGDALTFPYQAFAPRDGLGFGRRAILGYERTYTPELAVRANAEVVARLLVRWVPLGAAGTVLAAVGLRHGLAAPTRARLRAAVDALGADAFDDRHVRWLLAAPFASVVVGNVAFWGNLNVLGDLDVVADGLVWTLGPYYHFDLLVPTAVFGAVGGRAVVGRVRRARARTDGVRRHAVGALAVAGLLVAATVAVGALAHPLAANYETGQHLADAYDVDREYDDAVVFLPPAYGDWLNHPFQAYRNDPGFDGDVVYALDRDDGNFAVVEAFEDRAYYRYTYRGRWAPFDGESVEPRVQRVRHASGDRAGVAFSLGTPNWTVRAAVELEAEDGESVAYYVNDTEDDIDARLVVADGRARLVGDDVAPRTGDGSVPVDDTDTVTVDAFLDSRTGAGLTYRLEAPVRGGAGGDPSAVLTPYVETCVAFDTCGGEAAYLPSRAQDGVAATVSVWATGPTNASATDGPDAAAGRDPHGRSASRPTVDGTTPGVNPSVAPHRRLETARLRPDTRWYHRRLPDAEDVYRASHETVDMAAVPTRRPWWSS